MSSKMKHFLGVSAITIFLISWASAVAAKTERPRLLMTHHQLQNIPKDQRVILDTRSGFQYLWGHIPDAVRTGSWKDYSLDAREVRGQLNQDKKFLADRLNSLGVHPEKSIIIYGDPQNKWREDGRFFWMFEFLGFKKVYLLDNGFEGWESAGFPVERGPGPKPPHPGLKPEEIRFDPTTVADRQWILQRLGKPYFAVIDNREQSEYEGATPYGSERGGHIPGALHIDWREFFDAKGRLKPEQNLRALLNRHHIKPGMEVVVYCTGGVRSAMAYFVLRTLGFSVRNYDGSWWDWSHDPTLPIETS